MLTLVALGSLPSAAATSCIRRHCPVARTDATESIDKSSSHLCGEPPHLYYLIGTCESFFFVRIESRIESAVYTTQAVTQPDGLQAYCTGL